MIGLHHERREANSEEIPRKIDPAHRAVLLQEVAVEPSATYRFSGCVFSREKNGGWQRNNRARLITWSPPAKADPTSPGEQLLQAPELRERHSSQWYATGGRWLRFGREFTARGPRAVVGFELYRWWALEEDTILVDAARLTRICASTEN